MFISVFFIVVSTASLVLNTVPCLPLIGCRPAGNSSASANGTNGAHHEEGEHRVFEILEAVCVGRPSRSRYVAQSSSASASAFSDQTDRSFGAGAQNGSRWSTCCASRARRGSCTSCSAS